MRLLPLTFAPLLLAGCLPPTEEKGATPKGAVPAAATDWKKASHTAKAGTVEVRLQWAEVKTHIAGFRFGQLEDHGTLLVAQLRISNASPTKVVRLRNWYGAVPAQDEHGNTYKAHRFGSDFAFSQGWTPAREGDEKVNAGCDTAEVVAANFSLHPRKSYITYLFFERPATVSRELRLALPLGELEGHGEGALRVRVGIKR